MTQLCDRAAQTIGWELGGSRDQYYLRDIDEILEINRQLTLNEHVANCRETAARLPNEPQEIGDSCGSGVAVELAAPELCQEPLASSETSEELTSPSWIPTPTSSDPSPATSASGFAFDNAT